MGAYTGHPHPCYLVFQLHTAIQQLKQIAHTAFAKRCLLEEPSFDWNINLLSQTPIEQLNAFRIQMLNHLMLEHGNRSSWTIDDLERIKAVIEGLCITENEFYTTHTSNTRVD